jgi:hypothetical protein
MTMTSSPPIRTSSMVTMVSSGRNVRLARLYGSVMRSTSWTPSRMPINSGSILCAPTTPRTGARHAGRSMNIHPELDQTLDDGVDLRLCGPLVHYYDHIATLR